MNDFNIESNNWKDLLNQIELATGKFANNEVIGNKDSIFKLFSSVEEMKKEGYQPVTSDVFLSRSFKLITNQDVTERKKMNAYVKKQLEDKPIEEVIGPFKKVLSSYLELDAETLELEARSAFHHYRISKNSEFLSLANRLFDCAADRYLENGKVDKAFELREYQINFLTPEIKIDSTFADKTKWESSRGMYIDKRGGGELKQSTIHIQQFKSQKKQDEHVRLNFKISHPERERLQKRIDSLAKLKKQNLPTAFKNDIEVKTKQDFYYPSKTNSDPLKFGSVTEINFKGVGKFLVGDSKSIGSHYNYINIIVDSNKPEKQQLEDMQMILSYLGLGSSLSPNSPEDEDRKKIMLIFRTFFPRECYDFENDPKTFVMSPEDLLKSIIDKVPESKNTFLKYLNNEKELIKSEKLFEGKEVYTISDLSSAMREEGAVALFRGADATKNLDNSINIEATADTIVSNLENGRFSVQDRGETGVPVTGSSPAQDHGANSADNIFNRLITKNLLEKGEKHISDYPLSGDWQMIVNLKALNRGFYAYTSDKYGHKNRNSLYEIKSFKERLNPIEFTKSLQEEYIDENEVMIKNSLRPEYFQAIIVPNEDLKKAVIAKMVSKKMVEDINGILYYKGISLDKYIFVSKTLKKEMFS